MGHSTGQAFLHFVWATKGRNPCIPLALEPELYGVIIGQARKLGCETIAIGGMSDHVHILVRYGRNVTLGRLMNQVKGVSSAFINDRPDIVKQVFRWQPGYGYFTVGPSQVTRVVDYVVRQMQHHANGSLYPDWEETDAEDGD